MRRQLFAFHYAGKPAYQNSDRAFIDEWENAIDLYGKTFSGVTLVATPGSGTGLPDFGPPNATNSLFNQDCAFSGDMSCEAVTTILAHFMDSAVGANGKATQTSGMTASSPGTLATSDVGIAGVKLLSGLTGQLAAPSQILGGARCTRPL